MIDAFYRQTARVEDDHWWFVHRRAVVSILLARYAPGPAQRALDLGCGTGGNARLLADRAGVVVGLDRSALALDLARSKDVPSLLVRADVTRLAGTIAKASFDLVAVCNVLYHAWVPDPARVLADVREVLRDGGCVVWTEPAFPVLARRHDRVDQGTRRFHVREVRALLRHAGFEVCFASHFNAVSFVPALAAAAFDRVSGRAIAPVSADETVGEVEHPPWILDRALRAACWIERAALGRGVRLPVGVGVVAVGVAAERR